MRTKFMVGDTVYWTQHIGKTAVEKEGTVTAVDLRPNDKTVWYTVKDNNNSASHHLMESALR